jgi:nitroreductase
MKNDHDVGAVAEIRQILAERGTEHAESAEWRPVLFRLAQDGGHFALVDLLRRDGARLHVFDTLLGQLHDLIQTRHPTRKLRPAELESLTKDHLNNVPVDDYGVWVYYPWSSRLVHTLDETEFAELRTNRNRYKITPGEQAALASKRIGVVGLSVGQTVALTLALERSFGELRLAEFDRVDLSNLNRIRAGIHSLNVPKVYVTAREVAEIDPYLRITVFPEGINSSNAEAFLLDGGKLDVLVEECDSLDIKILVRYHARRHRVPVIMDTSDRGMLDIERFDLDADRPIFHGMAAGLDPYILSALTTEQKVPYILRILGSDTLSTRMRASMIEIEQTISTWPQLASAVTQGGAAAAHIARRIALGQTANSGRFHLDIGIDGIISDCTSQPIPGTSPAISTPRVPCADPLIRLLVSQAVLAPSGGNSQPWKWLSGDDEVHLLLDPVRSGSFIDFESCGSYVALGCAAENFVLGAHAAGREVRLIPFSHQTLPGHVCTFQLLRSDAPEVEPHWRDELHAQIPLRHTNRKLGLRQPLPQDDLDALTNALHSIACADLQWLTDDGELAEAGELMGIADRIRMLHPQAHREMFSELRWTGDEARSSHDGIDVETLFLSSSDFAGLEICRHWPSLELVRQWGGGRSLEKAARKYMAGSSAAGLLTMPWPRPIDFFNAGRALQRLWLVATERNLAIHPMTALPYLFARLFRGGGEGFDEQAIAELRRVRPIYERLFRVTPSTAEVLLFRIGHSEVVEKGSLRRPLDDVLSAM